MAIVPPWVEQGSVLLALFLSGLVVWWLDREHDWDGRLRSRFLLGVPWGTLVVCGFVLAVYLFVQSGLEHWYNPVVLPFRSWSYFYPLGIVTSAFAHQSAGHLLGNLFGTLVLGTLVEYAWGHFPERRGTTTFASAWTNPFVRAFGLFPAGVVIVGLLTGMFSLGPVAGFSGVVYALAGFAVVRFPLLTVVALTVDDAVHLLYQVFQNPVVSREASARFIEPWWAGTAIQGHLFGILLGALIGVLVFRRRRIQVSAARLWAGAILVGIAMNLWIIWWYRGNNSYVLYRLMGLWLVIVFGVVVVLAVRASDRALPAWLTVRRVALVALAILGGSWLAWRGFAAPAELPALATPLGALSLVDATLLVLVIVAGGGVVFGGARPLFGDMSRRDLAIMLIVLPVIFTAIVAVPASVVTIDDRDVPGDVSFDVRDYTVTYAENVTNGMVSVVNLSLLGETTTVRTSGVIVVSEDRHLWTTMASTSRLAFQGQVRVHVGGVGWRETIRALRRGWSAQGGPTTYVVFLEPPAGNWTLAHTAERAVAEPRLAGYRIGIRAGDSGFVLDLLRNGSVVTTRDIPEPGGSVTMEGIDFVREGRHIFATYDGTRVRIASRETYQ